MRRIIPMMMAAVMVLGLSVSAFGHCEIPCGIYDDQMRIELIREHITTIEKSMKTIQHLQGEKDQNANQLIRWVVNKEDHANKLQEIVSQYFMTQRIGLDADKYTEKVSLLHHMLIFAMKCKQTTDVDYIEKLRKSVDQFESLYFDKEKKK
ncbi:MAG: superoxide dismutase [Ni] [Desulfobacterales bacterium]